MNIDSLSDPKVALDIESTMADIETPFIAEYERRHRERVDGGWKEWGFGDTDFTEREFMRITASVWSNRPLDIPTTEVNVDDKAYLISKVVDRLDVVTGRVGQEEPMRKWLFQNGIEYNNFYSMDNGRSKASLDYDVFIDDRPGLADDLDADQHLMLYDQPYNRHVEETEQVTRIETLDHALQLFRSMQLSRLT